MKSPFKIGLLLAFAALPASAATYIGPAVGDWNTPGNWDSNTVPATATGESAVISNGATVDYPATALGDLNANGGGSITVSGGSRLKTDQSNWSQINNGTMILNNGTFSRTAAGNFVGSQIAGILGSPTTSAITATNSLIEVNAAATAGNLILGYTNFTTSTMNLVDSSIVVGGEVWLGSNTNNDTNQISTLNIYNSSITTKGAVGLWVWDYAATGNTMRINFTGPAGSSINVSDSIGIRADATGANNAATWESLWDLGILTAEGQSGLTGAQFGSHFVTAGTNIRDGAVPIPYSLTYIPEASTSLLTLLTGGLLLGRRRRHTHAS